MDAFFHFGHRKALIKKAFMNPIITQTKGWLVFSYSLIREPPRNIFMQRGPYFTELQKTQVKNIQDLKIENKQKEGKYIIYGSSRKYGVYRSCHLSSLKCACTVQLLRPGTPFTKIRKSSIFHLRTFCIWIFLFWSHFSYQQRRWIVSPPAQSTRSLLCLYNC